MYHPSHHRDNVSAPHGRPNLRSRLHFSHSQEGDHESSYEHVVALKKNLIGLKAESELMMSSLQLMGQSELSTVLNTVLTSRDCTRHCNMGAGFTNMVTDAGRSIGKRYRKS